MWFGSRKWFSTGAVRGVLGWGESGPYDTELIPCLMRAGHAPSPVLGGLSFSGTELCSQGWKGYLICPHCGTPCERGRFQTQVVPSESKIVELFLVPQNLW